MPRKQANDCPACGSGQQGLAERVRGDHAAGLALTEAPRPTFVLSGGGNLGALQVGMMYALVEQGIRPGMIVGTSIGAINGGFLAGRSDLNGVGEIAQFWAGLHRRDVFSLNARSLARGAFGLDAHFFDSKPIRRIVESFLTFDRLERAPLRIAVIATVLGTADAAVLESGDAVTALLASSAIPRVLPPVEIDGRFLVDGSAAADLPILEALKLGAREILVLPTAPIQVTRALKKLQRETTADGRASDRPEIQIVPPPEVHVRLGDLSQSRQLLRLGYERTHAWLEVGGGSAAVRTPHANERRTRRDRQRGRHTPDAR